MPAYTSIFPGLKSGVRSVATSDNSIQTCNNKNRADDVKTTQHESGLSYEDMNTHEQTDSPGQTTVK